MKPPIPAVPPADPGMYQVLMALKENIELITGRRGSTVAELDPSATLDEVVEKLNEVIQVLMS